MSLSDTEDGPPNAQPPRSYPEHSETLPPPPPGKVTMSPADADRIMVQQALLRVADSTERVEALLETLATKADFRALDLGIGMANRGIDELRQEMRQNVEDVKLWLFGDADRAGLAQAIDANTKLAHDALIAARSVAGRNEETTKLASTLYDAITHGPGSPQHEELRKIGAPR